MKLKGEELVTKVSQLDVPPVVTIVGTEDFLRQEATHLLLHRVHNGVPVEEDTSRLTGSNKIGPGDLTQLFDDLRTPSLFGGDRTVVIENAGPFLAADRDAWIPFLEVGFTGAHLFLVMDELDGRTKLAKALERHGLLVKVEKPFHRPPPWKPHAPPWENPLNAWLVRRARQLELDLDAPAAHVLQSRVGTSLGDLASALERLSTVVPAGKKVTAEIIVAHTPDGEESNLFELVDVLYSGDRKRTLELVRDIHHRGSVDRRGARVTDPSSLLLQFLGAALRRARQLREVHRVLAAGGGEPELLSAAGVARPFLPALRQQAKVSSPRVIQRLIAQFRRADQDLKSGRGPRADELLERIVCAR